MIEEYLEKRKEMKRVFMLIDFRIKPTENDIMMYKFLKYYHIPVTIVITKADTINDPNNLLRFILFYCPFSKR